MLRGGCSSAAMAVGGSYGSAMKKLKIDGHGSNKYLFYLVADVDMNLFYVERHFKS
jgi:hypothetical protein